MITMNNNRKKTKQNVEAINVKKKNVDNETEDQRQSG